MDSEENFDQLRCCISGLPFHFVQVPIMLSCGHSVCEICSKHEIEQDQIKCALCNSINNHRLDMVPFKTNIEETIQMNLEKISMKLHDIHDRIENEITGNLIKIFNNYFII